MIDAGEDNVGNTIRQRTIKISRFNDAHRRHRRFSDTIDIAFSLSLSRFFLKGKEKFRWRAYSSSRWWLAASCNLGIARRARTLLLIKYSVTCLVLWLGFVELLEWLLLTSFAREKWWMFNLKLSYTNTVKINSEIFYLEIHFFFFLFALYSTRYEDKTFPNLIILLKNGKSVSWSFNIADACALTATLWFWTLRYLYYVIFVFSFTNIWFIIVVTSVWVYNNQIIKPTVNIIRNIRYIIQNHKVAVRTYAPAALND